MTTASSILWQLSQQEKSHSCAGKFLVHINKRYGMSLRCQEDLHQWSIENMALFWKEVWLWTHVIGDLDETTLLKNKDDIMGAIFFEGSRLNFAENLLRTRGPDTALVFWGEDQVKRALSYDGLYDRVSILVQHLKNMGFKTGDRAAGLMPNTPDAIVAMLAVTTLGGIWAACSPDFGVQGILDRFQQIDPTVLFVTDFYLYKGKAHPISEKLADLQNALPTLKQTILFGYTGQATTPLPHTIPWDKVQQNYQVIHLQFERFPFNTPLYIMFSSGTTGAPKCIVHGAGGTLLQHMKEHQLHTNIQAQDRVFYFTTCGWMMWHWQVSALASGATLLLFDGNPFYPNGHILFQYAAAEKMTLFGTAAKYISALEKENIYPKRHHNLSCLKTMTSTGSPLAAESFDFVYTHIKDDLHLASISGGTDIITCFVLGTPLKPVVRGEIQCKGLGMAVAVYDEAGRPTIGQKGELVCTAPFPSRPLGFWNDPHNEKYKKTYFDKFPGVWCHGDFCVETPEGGIVILGRSDAVLNRGGVRIGTAEIYRQVEKIPEVLESIVVGQPYQGDVRIILFVKMETPGTLNPDIHKKIVQQIRSETTPRHVPDLIIEAPDIPRTKNGKIVELAVSAILQGQPIKNKEALQNPEVLDFFKNLDALR